MCMIKCVYIYFKKIQTDLQLILCTNLYDIDDIFGYLNGKNLTIIGGDI